MPSNNVRTIAKIRADAKKRGAKVNWKLHLAHGNIKEGHTPGGLKRADIVKNKRGRWVSKKQQARGYKLHAAMKKKGKLAPQFRCPNPKK